MAVGVCLLMALFFTSTNVIVSLSIGIPLLIIFTWSQIIIQRSNIDSRLKRNSLIMIFVLISIVGRMYYLVSG